MMRPSGVVSKKLTGARSTRASIFLCSAAAASMPPSAKATVLSSVTSAVAHVSAAYTDR